jgi:hypothetical protein
VFGQGGSFTSNTCNLGGISASSLCGSFGVAMDAAGNLYVADYGNNRVLEYSTPLTTDTVADRVFGQGGSRTNSACDLGGISASSLCGPAGVAFDSAGHLYVADQHNSRVLEYDTNTDSDGDSLGQTTIKTGGACDTGGLALPKFRDCVETFIGTDPDRACAATSTAGDEAVDAMPADLNNDQKVNVTDRTKMVLQLKAYIANPATGYNKCYDLNADGAVNVTDRTIVALYIRLTGGLPCTP